VTAKLVEVFGDPFHLQISEVHLCADVDGWDVSTCDKEVHRKRLRSMQQEAMDPQGFFCVHLSAFSAPFWSPGTAKDSTFLLVLLSELIVLANSKTSFILSAKPENCKHEKRIRQHYQDWVHPQVS